MILRPSHQLQGKVGLHAVVDIRGTAGIETPSSVLVLVTQNLVQRALHFAGLARSKQRVHKDVVGLEHHIGFELSTPIAIFVLLTQQPVRGATNAVQNLVEAKVQPAEPRLQRLVRRLRVIGTFDHL